MSAIYTPSSYDFYDDSVNENAVGGETASMVLAGTHKLAGPKMVLTGGLQRNIPQKIEKDIEGATFESTNEGGTTLSFGAQMNFGDFQPRAGLSTFTSQDDTAQLLGIGTDYMINTIAITGDVAFMNGDFKSGDTDAKITGFNFSAGVSTMF